MNCVPMAEVLAGFSDDGFLGGRLVLRQPRQGHRAGHDAMVLAGSTAANPGDRVVEFGAGVGAAGLALATRVAGLDLVLVEIDPALTQLAQHNAVSNGIAAHGIVLDVAASAEIFAAAGLVPDSTDAVLMNPPFNNAGQHRASPDKGRAVAHVANPMTLADWVHAARRILKSGGALTMIWRADGLAEILATLDRGFGSVVIQPVHATPDGAAIRVLLRAVKGGRAPLRLFPALILTSSDVKSALLNATALPLAKV